MLLLREKVGGGKTFFRNNLGGYQIPIFARENLWGETFEREKGGFTGRGGSVFLVADRSEFCAPPPKPQSELGAPPPLRDHSMEM